MGERKQKPEAPNLAEKGLPVNLDAERYVLGSIMLNSGLYVETAGTLQVDDFSLEKHRRIFTRMGDLQARGMDIDRVTLANELLRNAELESVGGLTYLVSLDDGLPKITNIDSYVQIVKDKSVLRKTIAASQSLIDRCMLEDKAEDLQVSAEQIIMGLGDVERDGGPQTLGEILSDLPGGVGEFLGPQKQGLPTGFMKFDELTGGLHDEDFILLAARPSMGKTAMALNIAQHITTKRGDPVVVFSLEMSKLALLRRMVCAQARVDSQRVRLDYLNAEERMRLLQATNLLAKAPLYIDDKSAVTLPDMHARIRKLMGKRKPRLVIVDYLQLMSAGKDYESKNQEVTAISRGLKLLGKEIGCPIMALSQLSRAPELRKGKQRPQLSDLRESGSLEQDADVVAFIFREEVYRPNDESLHGEAELILAKQRNGPTGIVNLVFLHNYTKFENKADDVQEPAPLLKSRGKENAAADFSD